MNRKLLLSIPALLLGALSVQQAQAQPHPETPIYFNAPTIDDNHARDALTRFWETPIVLPTGAQATAAPGETPIYFYTHPVEAATTTTPKSIPNAQQKVESPGTPIYFRNSRS